MSFNMMEEVKKYYAEKFKSYGLTSKGVDWNSAEGHYRRFEVAFEGGLKSGDSILDVGAGYGAFYDFLKKRFGNFEY